MKNVINIMDLSVEEIDQLIHCADDIIDNRIKYQDACRHKILATLFFEPSTRTRLSFESAMLSLGGSVLGFSEASSSSASKGESVADTISVVSGYADIIAMRHPNRLVRRPKIRAYRSLAHRRDVSLFRGKVCFDFSGGAQASKLCKTGIYKAAGH